jgi:hypothetical protein
MKAWRRRSREGAAAAACAFPASGLVLSNEDGDGLVTWNSANGDPTSGWDLRWQVFMDDVWTEIIADTEAGNARQETQLALANSVPGNWRVLIRSFGDPAECTAVSNEQLFT